MLMVLHFAHKVGEADAVVARLGTPAHGDAHPSPGYPTRANQRCKKNEWNTYK